MKFLLNKPLDQASFEMWNKLDQPFKHAFIFVMGICLLAYGFEMTNLSLHHDDVNHIFMRVLGLGMGRFGFDWEHNYIQGGYFMPFLQMIEGITLMTIYGLMISHFWGARKTLDIVLIASIVCVFPFMGQIYQYETSVVASSMAHFLVAAAVIVSTRASYLSIGFSAILYLAAFSIYQSVVANAATIFVIWMLTKLLFAESNNSFFSKSMAKSLFTALASVLLGGVLYLAVVFSMDIEFDTYQASGQAFNMEGGFNLGLAIEKIITGTRAFFFWPEHYFPDYLKKIQLIFLLFAVIVSLWLPKKMSHKIAALAILCMALITPRILQFLHAEGLFHNLTITAYAVLIAACVMVVNRSGITFVRNLSAILAFILIAGYVIQCNWISTVNKLNSMAHFSMVTQVLTRVRSLPNVDWDGKNIVVVGRYDMSSEYPFKIATGVATEFVDARHMKSIARLMRDDALFVNADQNYPKVLEYASKNKTWPHPSSVAIVDGKGVVVFSKEIDQTVE